MKWISTLRPTRFLVVVGLVSAGAPFTMALAAEAFGLPVDPVLHAQAAAPPPPDVFHVLRYPLRLELLLHILTLAQKAKPTC